MLDKNNSILILNDKIVTPKTDSFMGIGYVKGASPLVEKRFKKRNLFPGAVEAPIKQTAKRSPLTVTLQVLRKDSLYSFVNGEFDFFAKFFAKFERNSNVTVTSALRQYYFSKNEPLQSKSTGDKPFKGGIDRSGFGYYCRVAVV